MRIVAVDAWLALLACLIAIAVSYTLLELVKRLSAQARPRARLCRVSGGAVAAGIGLWCSNTIAALAAVPALHWSTLSVAQIFLPLPVALLGPAAILTILSGGQARFARIAGAAACGGVGFLAAYQMSVAELLGGSGFAGSALWLGAALVCVPLACAAALWLLFRSIEARSWRAVARRGAASLVGAAAIIALHALALKNGHLVFGAFCSVGPSSSVQLLSITLAALACAVLAVTHVITVYGGKLELRSKRYARELEEVHSRLHYLATHDSLTGLPNWVLFKERLAHAVGDTGRPGRAIAVAVLDLDRFSSVNHSLGHGAGDWLLTEVARRVGSVLRHEDTLARLGSDEFVFFIDSVAARFEAEHVTARILTALKEPIWVNGSEVHIRPSIGVSVWPDDGLRVDDLLTHAEAAMSVVKRNSGNEVRFFERGMIDSTQERLALENDLRRALVAGEFELWYQPEVLTKSGKTAAAEALLRWRHPTRGVISPSSFIPLAEETGLMIPLGEWVLREACRQAGAWQMSHGGPVRLAVNLSATQFRHQNLVGIIRSALQDAHLDASCLEVELTESSVMTNPDESVEVLSQLRKMGVTVAIDDFGTGYSSLSYLRRFPIDKLKIDRSFIRDLTTSETDASIVRAIILLAHSVGLQVVAEGVETEEQLEFIRTLDCDQWQGNYCCEPQPATRFSEMLIERAGSRPGVSPSYCRPPLRFES
jgi:diguanylate cyclase (GGDEF)-like protein